MTENKNSPPSEQVKGSVKEAIGKLTGDVRVESEGRRQKQKGEAPQKSPSKAPGSGRG